jgi:hypothetical protein
MLTSPAWPWRPPFTVDLLFELPDNGFRYEVVEGALIASQWSSPGTALPAAG